MSNTMIWMLAALGGELLLLVLVLLLVSWVRNRAARRRDQKAMQALAARVRKGRSDREAVLQAFLARSLGLEGEALTADSFPQLSEMLGEQEADPSAPLHEGVGVMLYTEDGNLRPLEEIEADVIRLAIGHYRGRMTEVARRLGIGRSTLYRKLSDLGIDNAA